MSNVEKERPVLVLPDKGERFVGVTPRHVVHPGRLLDHLFVAVHPMDHAVVVGAHDAEPIVVPASHGVQLCFKELALSYVEFAYHPGGIAGLL